jgi:hypothetical protein
MSHHRPLSAPQLAPGTTIPFHFSQDLPARSCWLAKNAISQLASNACMHALHNAHSASASAPSPSPSPSTFHLHLHQHLHLALFSGRILGIGSHSYIRGAGKRRTAAAAAAGQSRAEQGILLEIMQGAPPPYTHHNSIISFHRDWELGNLVGLYLTN